MTGLYSEERAWTADIMMPGYRLQTAGKQSTEEIDAPVHNVFLSRVSRAATAGSIRHVHNGEIT